MIIQLAVLEAKRSVFSKIIPNKFSIRLFCKLTITFRPNLSFLKDALIQNQFPELHRKLLKFDFLQVLLEFR